MKVILCLAFGLIVVVGDAWMWGAKTSASRQQSAADIQRARNEKIIRDNYREDLDRAKTDGSNKVIILSSGVPSSTRSIEDILTRGYSLLRVRVIDKEITVDKDYLDIFTWYKLEIVEALHQQSKIDDNPLPEDMPNHLFPSLPSETVLVMPGGSITVDGVRIVRKIGDGEFALSKQYEYLITAKLDCEGKLIRPASGSAGVYRIENKNLKSLDKRQHHPLVREVEQVYGSYLDNLRYDARLRPRRGN